MHPIRLRGRLASPLLALVFACESAEAPPTASTDSAETPDRGTTPEAHPEQVVTHGTEVCVRCGELREVRVLVDGVTRTEQRSSKARDWAATCIEGCIAHDWTRTGCWYSRSGGSVSVECSLVPDGHSLWKALAALDDEPARELGRRFADLPADRQRQAWHHLAGRAGRATPREVARTAALDCGLPELAAHWDG